MRTLYITSLLVGTCIAALVYGVFFNDLSETTLVNLTAVWAFPVAFGAYGLLAGRLNAIVESGQASSIGAAVRPWLRFGLLNIVLLVLLLPLLFARTRKPLTAALLGSGIWAVLLLFFFNVVFPSL